MKTSTLGLRALLIIILASTGPVLAQTPGSLFLGEDRAPALSLAMDTRIEVSGLVARVSISQTFLYRGLEPVEGLYEFPLPTGAAVDTLRVTLDDRVIVGEIHERETARRRYEQARNQGRRAALVEQHKANLFATNVANIEPGVPVTVEIAYQQPVVFREGQFELRVPFVVTPRYTPAGDARDLLSPPDEDCECGYAPETTAIDVKLNGAWRISDISSPSHKLQIETEPDAFRVSLAPDTPLNGDFVLRWTPLVERQVATSVYTESFAGEDYALVLFVPSLQPRPAVPREVIFVIDTSGSMHGPAIEQAKAALISALSGLRPGDLFNVIQFNSVTESLFPASVAAGAWPRGQAENYIRHLTADGGTEMAPALIAALDSPAPAGYLRQVVFVTDGAIDNETELFELIAAHLDEARLFTVGIGSAPNQLFMERAARAGRGVATYISDGREVAERMTALFDRLSMPVLTDIRIEAGGKEAIVPDVYAGEPTVVSLKLPLATDLINVKGVAGGTIWAQQLAIGERRDQAGVAKLWARQRIAELMESTVTGADPDRVREQVVDLGVRFGLTSRFTSLVAVEKTPRLAAGAPGRARVPTPMPAAAFPRTAAGVHHRLAWMLMFALAALVAMRAGD